MTDDLGDARTHDIPDRCRAGTVRSVQVIKPIVDYPVGKATAK